jgi:nicotinic acid mononucleotide adenylyltransferase
MSGNLFVGTFDPMHGAHIGQLLRAYKFRPFSQALILVDKNPSHKPNASNWQCRLDIAKLVFAAVDLPFRYRIMATEDSLAPESNEKIDYKVTGIDSVLDNLSDPPRWAFVQKWPMIVLSIPGIEKDELDRAIQGLPAKEGKKINFEYVSGIEAPIMNYDFGTGQFISRRVHATNIRAGEDTSLLPATAQEYISEHHLYEDLGRPSQ